MFEAEAYQEQTETKKEAEKDVKKKRIGEDEETEKKNKKKQDGELKRENKKIKI